MLLPATSSCQIHTHVRHNGSHQVDAAAHLHEILQRKNTGCLQCFVAQHIVREREITQSDECRYVDLYINTAVSQSTQQLSKVMCAAYMLQLGARQVQLNHARRWPVQHLSVIRMRRSERQRRVRIPVQDNIVTKSRLVFSRAATVRVD